MSDFKKGDWDKARTYNIGDCITLSENSKTIERLLKVPGGIIYSFLIDKNTVSETNGSVFVPDKE